MEENKQHKTALPETEPIPSAQAPDCLLYTSDAADE